MIGSLNTNFPWANEYIYSAYNKIHRIDTEGGSPLIRSKGYTFSDFPYGSIAIFIIKPVKFIV